MPPCFVLIHVMLALAGAPHGPSLDRVDFAARFKGFDGCFVIQPLDGQWSLRHNEKRCAQRFAPCSTFKVFNALAGLETGAVTGPDTKFKWDGTPQNRKVCEQDHTLASAIRDSVVWYFQEVASRVGEQRMQQFLDQNDYGNRDISGGIRKFWLQTSLDISADEQVRFLAKLYRDELSFKREHMETVRKLIVHESGPGWTFSGKSGTGGSGDKAILGWFVGHVESHGRQYVFALNISAADGANGFTTARKIARRILQDLELLD